MKTTELKITRIGNSRGVRLPAATLRRYGMNRVVQMAEKADAIVLRPLNAGPEKLSWAQTAQAMASAEESWVAWDSLSGEGLEALPWEDRKMRVAEAGTQYGARKRKGNRP